MPERDYQSIDPVGREAIANYVPGYDWMPGRFGPPPGIPKGRKEQLGMLCLLSGLKDLSVLSAISVTHAQVLSCLYSSHNTVQWSR